MIAKMNSASVLGIDAHPVDVKVDVSIGLSTFNIVGLLDGKIKESRDWVTAAVTNVVSIFRSGGSWSIWPRRHCVRSDRDSTFLSPWPWWERFVIFLNKFWKK